MKPGRELDALVAEKVMGLAWDTFTDDYGEQLYVLWDRKKVGGPPAGDLWPLPRYSEDIAAAWEVVERVVENFESRNNTVTFGVARLLDCSGYCASFTINHELLLSHDDPMDS